MDEARTTQLRRQIATLRDPAGGRDQRAFAATLISAACAGEEPAAAAARFDSPNQRMFGYGLRHDTAREWDGRSVRSGTITFVDDERIEQYIGQQQWIAYRQSDLAEPGFVLGDQVRIAGRDGRFKIEAIGSNRLAGEPPESAASVRSGMVILRTRELEAGEIAAAAQTTAERYAADLREDPDRVTLTFPRGGELVIIPFPVDGVQPAIAIVADLVSESICAAVRLEAVVAATLPGTALEAECALAYCAALVAARGEAIAIDDTWAVLSAEQLYELAVRDDTRAALFGLASSAAQNAWPAQTSWFSQRRGVCDELTIYSSRPWRADLASAFLKRSLDAFSDAIRRTNDAVIPVQGSLFSKDEYDEPGAVQRLLSLAYDTVELDVAFVDASLAAGPLRAQIQARQDAAALLGAEIQTAVVISFGNRSDDTQSERALEMQRADTLATALGASFARRTDGVAVDLAGAIYCADDLVELALQRRGKAASWTARVASALNTRLVNEAQLSTLQATRTEAVP